MRGKVPATIILPRLKVELSYITTDFAIFL